MIQINNQESDDEESQEIPLEINETDKQKIIQYSWISFIFSQAIQHISLYLLSIEDQNVKYIYNLQAISSP